MYLVIELQKTSPDTVANIVTAHSNLNDAYAKYHTVLAAAAVSSVPSHSAVMITDKGGLICADSFDHETGGGD